MRSWASLGESGCLSIFGVILWDTRNKDFEKANIDTSFHHLIKIFRSLLNLSSSIRYVCVETNIIYMEQYICIYTHTKIYVHMAAWEFQISSGSSFNSPLFASLLASSRNYIAYTCRIWNYRTLSKVTQWGECLFPTRNAHFPFAVFPRKVKGSKVYFYLNERKNRMLKITEPIKEEKPNLGLKSRRMCGIRHYKK